MRLAALLADMPPEQLERLAEEHLGHDQDISRSLLYTTLEGALRSYPVVRDFIVNRQPPTFAILESLLDAPECAAPIGGFRELVMEKTRLLSGAVTAGDILGRDDQLRLYRRVFVEARRSDLSLDPSEAAILGVLRRELGIRLVEHFLLEHHSDFHPFWNGDSAFLHEMDALRRKGVVFAHEGTFRLAEEVVPLVRQSLGLEMPGAGRARLYSHLSGADLNEALGEAKLRTSGSKEEKFNRLLANYVQPSDVLQSLSLVTLRELCRTTGAAVSGAKDELVDRLVNHFLYAVDQRPATEPASPPPTEPRQLDERRFRALFSALKGHELTDVLSGINSTRLSGAKDIKIATLWRSPFSEETLLSGLTNRCLEELLARTRLKVSGSKRERIVRIIDFFKTAPEATLEERAGDEPPPTDGRPTETAS